MTAAPSIAPPAGRVPAAGATTILADAAGIDLNRLPGCDLEPHELRALASTIALDPRAGVSTSPSPTANAIT